MAQEVISSVDYEYQNRPRELVSSNGFSVEYDPVVTDEELRDDIISYLGEYRFAVEKYDYSLVYSEGSLRDSRRGEPMSVKASRSVKERLMRGEKVNREAAEATGLNFLDEQLKNANLGDSVVWASPPGDRDEGYGDYGFFYVGQIKRSIENRKQIEMAAYRVEKPTLEMYKSTFHTLTDIDYEAKIPEDYLKFPVVVNRQIDEVFIAETLSNNFPFEMNSEKRQIFDLAMEIVSPKIDEFILMMRWASVEERRKAFHALENYSLKVKRELEEGRVTIFEVEDSFEQFINSYGFEPPKTAGSCPIKTNGLSSLGYESLNKNLNKEWFTCPDCGYEANGPVGNTCPGCGLTKEKYSEKAQQVCE